ncbi:hypothetical protein TL16_g13238, partial [Triparma laevis f. inornata]
MKIDPQSFLLLLTSSSSPLPSTLISQFLDYAENPGKVESKGSDDGEETEEFKGFVEKLKVIVEAWGGEAGEHSTLITIALKRLTSITSRRALTPTELHTLQLPSPITEGNTLTEISTLLKVLETCTLFLPPPPSQLQTLQSLLSPLSSFFPPNSSPLDILISCSLTGGKGGNINEVIKECTEFVEWVEGKNLPVTKIRLGCLGMLEDVEGISRSLAQNLINLGNATGALQSLLSLPFNNPCRPTISSLVYTLYLSPSSSSSLSRDDLIVLSDCYSLSMGRTIWKGGEVCIGCYLIDCLRRLNPLPLDMILKVCKREDVKVEDVLEKGGFIREIKKQGTKEVMESLAVLAEKDENTRRTFRRWFEHADEGILLPLGEGLPRLLSAIDVRNDERWGRKAKLFSTCVDVLTTLSTTPQNYPTLTLCLQQMLNCLEIMDGHMAVETVKKVMHSPKLVHALSSVLTFPVTTARKGEERVGRKKTRKGWGEWSYMEEERFEERKRE